MYENTSYQELWPVFTDPHFRRYLTHVSPDPYKFVDLALSFGIFVGTPEVFILTLTLAGTVLSRHREFQSHPKLNSTGDRRRKMSRTRLNPR